MIHPGQLPVVLSVGKKSLGQNSEYFYNEKFKKGSRYLFILKLCYHWIRAMALYEGSKRALGWRAVQSQKKWWLAPELFGVSEHGVLAPENADGFAVFQMPSKT